jgi:hypothetical protein
MTNKYTAWTGNVPTINIVSSAKSADSLAAHPSTSTYGFSVTVLTAANLRNTVLQG